MIWALDEEGNRITAEQGRKAVCPVCRAVTVAKCGKIIAPHWAHQSRKDCDPWYEPETQWHIDWKNRFPKVCQEVVMGNHRADVRLPTGVIEFQNSPISADEIIERERFYGNMVWVVNAEKRRGNIDFRERNGYVSFRWKRPQVSWFFARCPVILDLGVYLFWIKQLHPLTPCGGWGGFLRKEGVSGILAMQWRRKETELDKFLRYGLTMDAVRDNGVEWARFEVKLMDALTEAQIP